MMPQHPTANLAFIHRYLSYTAVLEFSAAYEAVYEQCEKLSEKDPKSKVKKEHLQEILQKLHELNTSSKVNRSQINELIQLINNKSEALSQHRYPIWQTNLLLVFLYLTFIPLVLSLFIKPLRLKFSGDKTRSQQVVDELKMQLANLSISAKLLQEETDEQQSVSDQTATLQRQVQELTSHGKPIVEQRAQQLQREVDAKLQIQLAKVEELTAKLQQAKEGLSQHVTRKVISKMQAAEQRLAEKEARLADLEKRLAQLRSDIDVKIAEAAKGLTAQAQTVYREQLEKLQQELEKRETQIARLEAMQRELARTVPKKRIATALPSDDVMIAVLQRLPSSTMRTMRLVSREMKAAIDNLDWETQLISIKPDIQSVLAAVKARCNDPEDYKLKLFKVFQKVKSLGEHRLGYIVNEYVIWGLLNSLERIPLAEREANWDTTVMGLILGGHASELRKFLIGYAHRHGPIPEATAGLFIELAGYNQDPAVLYVLDELYPAAYHSGLEEMRVHASPKAREFFARKQHVDQSLANKDGQLASKDDQIDKLTEKAKQTKRVLEINQRKLYRIKYNLLPVFSQAWSTHPIFHEINNEATPFYQR